MQMEFLPTAPLLHSPRRRCRPARTAGPPCRGTQSLRFEHSQLAGDLYGMKGHEVKRVHLARSADVPLDGRRRALEVVEMMFDPLAENVENPVRQRHVDSISGCIVLHAYTCAQ
ncbi:hypothetical protein EYF80_024120 [Liparis tanakae]|uniref:Uncharacterized protein n=1 Tax=Liparis tanakae TaxID=230148 RepID=A0A4Z2HJ19_9TELE|nr:hypothetical protein EYF80_024120 [Liparis tanakae]